MEHRNKTIFNIKKLIEQFDLPVFERHLQVYHSHGIRPCLATILTGDDPGSVSYVQGINKFTKEQNIIFENHTVGSRRELEKKIIDLNQDKNVHGIMILYPSRFDVRDTYFMNLVSLDKDVEGLHSAHLGYLVQHEKFKDPQKLRKLIIPPTPKGILYLLKRYARLFDQAMRRKKTPSAGRIINPFQIEGKSITIINDSLAVGRSLALMLLNENGSVRICHEYTSFSDILDFIRTSDIIISAVPKPDFIIPTEAVPKDSIIIDVSFSGNFEYPSIFEKALKIAPKWNLVEKGNRINDLTLCRLVSNLFYLINSHLSDEIIQEIGR